MPASKQHRERDQISDSCGDVKKENTCYITSGFETDQRSKLKSDPTS